MPQRIETLDDLIFCAARLIEGVIREDGQMDHPVIFAIDRDGDFGIMPLPNPRNAAMNDMMTEALATLLQGLGVRLYVFCMEGWMRSAKPGTETEEEGPTVEVVLITGQSSTDEKAIAFPMVRGEGGAFVGLDHHIARPMKPSRSELGNWGRLLRTSAAPTVH